MDQRLIVSDSTKERDEQATKVTEEKCIGSIFIFLLQKLALKVFAVLACFT